jgi:hypothetical protein
MNIVEQILEAAAGMTLEEVQAEVEASVHAAECNPAAVAEAIVSAAG